MMNDLLGYGAVLVFAVLVMWGLSKLPARLRRGTDTRHRKLIRSQAGRSR